METFSSLQENDILFVDSSHVPKIGSDVNHIIFEVLPSLNPGVNIHFHDVFAGFEYLQNWVYGGANRTRATSYGLSTSTTTSLKLSSSTAFWRGFTTTRWRLPCR